MNLKPQIIVGLTELRKLADFIHFKYKFDFSHYAVASFQRRVVRVMEINKFNTIDDLIKKLSTDSLFYDDFLKEITVNTTEMFRDPGLWRALRENILPELQNKTTIRIWHAGCSSGEEIYSMAILLKEAGFNGNVKIWATDINSKVIDTAKEGKYPIRNMELNEANYLRFEGKKLLKDYYTVKDGFAFMNKDLLTNVTFKIHNLSEKEVFCKFDLILCRNVLIYFDKVLQDDVFKLFHESLNRHAYFVIGSKESMIWSSINHKFKIVNDREKIYQAVM